MKLNYKLSFLEKEIYDAINYENIDKFKDIGGMEQVDLNFKIDVDSKTSFYPI